MIGAEDSSGGAVGGTMKLLEILGSTQIPVAYRMSFLTNFWREPLLKKLERAHGIIRPELTVLICLNFRNGVHARDICEITEQPSNTVSRAVVALEEKGLISRKQDPEDQRRNILSMTPKGQRLHDVIMKDFALAEAALLATLSKDEVALLTNLLDRLSRDVGSWTRAEGYRECFASTNRSLSLPSHGLLRSEDPDAPAS